MPGAEGSPDTMEKQAFVPKAVEGTEDLLAAAEQDDVAGKLKQLVKID